MTFFRHGKQPAYWIHFKYYFEIIVLMAIFIVFAANINLHRLTVFNKMTEIVRIELVYYNILFSLGECSWQSAGVHMLRHSIQTYVGNRESACVVCVSMEWSMKRHPTFDLPIVLPIQTFWIFNRTAYQLPIDFQNCFCCHSAMNNCHPFAIFYTFYAFLRIHFYSKLQYN